MVETSHPQNRIIGEIQFLGHIWILRVLYSDILYCPFWTMIIMKPMLTTTCYQPQCNSRDMNPHSSFFIDVLQGQYANMPKKWPKCWWIFPKETLFAPLLLGRNKQFPEQIFITKEIWREFVEDWWKSDQIWLCYYTPWSLTARTWKGTILNGKSSLLTIIFQKRTVNLRGSS